MTQIDEPNLDEQIDELLRILYVFGSTVTIKDYKTAKQAIKALIATQVEQARGCVDCKKLRCENCERLWQT